jgi:hypothetical protein
VPNLFPSLWIISALSYCGLHGMQWDEVEIVHKEGNRITGKQDLALGYFCFIPTVLCANHRIQWDKAEAIHIHPGSKPIHKAPMWVPLEQEKNNLNIVLRETIAKLSWWPRG